MNDKDQALLTLTVDIVAVHVSSNVLAASEVPKAIKAVHAALAGLGKEEPLESEKPARPMSIRASIKPDYLVSMIDGKPYKALRCHITRHGYTPESYKQAFDLPSDYPMVAAAYSDLRRAMAKKIGLGRKPGTRVKAVKRTRKPKE